MPVNNGWSTWYTIQHRTVLISLTFSFIYQRVISAQMEYEYRVHCNNGGMDMKQIDTTESGALEASLSADCGTTKPSWCCSLPQERRTRRNEVIGSHRVSSEMFYYMMT